MSDRNCYQKSQVVGQGYIFTFTCGQFRNIYIRSTLNSSGNVGSFTMANSNSFLSPYEILPIAEENKYLRKIFLFDHVFVCCVCVYS